MSLKRVETGIEGLCVIESRQFDDPRGYFKEIFNVDAWEAIGLPLQVRQINQSGSRRGVVRGLHFQWDAPMGKLMRVASGEAFLVAVDIRPGSPTLGRWHGIHASATDGRQLWGEPGFARGFAALSEFCEIQYCCTATYNPRGESGILWNDPEIGVEWPVAQPLLSEKDAVAQPLRDWLARPEAAVFAVG